MPEIMQSNVKEEKEMSKLEKYTRCFYIRVIEVLKLKMNVLFLGSTKYILLLLICENNLLLLLEKWCRE